MGKRGNACYDSIIILYQLFQIAFRFELVRPKSSMPLMTFISWTDFPAHFTYNNEVFCINATQIKNVKVSEIEFKKEIRLFCRIVMVQQITR